MDVRRSTLAQIDAQKRIRRDITTVLYMGEPLLNWVQQRRICAAAACL